MSRVNCFVQNRAPSDNAVWGKRKGKKLSEPQYRLHSSFGPAHHMNLCMSELLGHWNVLVMKI